MSNDRRWVLFCVALFAATLCGSVTHAAIPGGTLEFVTGFEHDPGGFPVPNPNDPSTALIIPVDAGGETVAFGNNSATFSGGAWAWAAAPDFYRDGLFEWIQPTSIEFDTPVRAVEFAFWSLLGDAAQGATFFNPTVNGGRDTGVFVEAFNAAGQRVDVALTLPILYDNALIGPEGVVSLFDNDGIKSIRFGIAPNAGNIPLLGYGIDGLYASAVPVPAAVWMLISGVSVLVGWRRRVAN